jgi:hypothetical protein
MPVGVGVIALVWVLERRCRHRRARQGIFFAIEGDRDLLNLSELLIESGMAMASEYPFVAEILTPTQGSLPARLGWGQFVRARGC